MVQVRSHVFLLIILRFPNLVSLIYWVFYTKKGLQTYVLDRGFNDPVLLKFAIALLAHYELLSSHWAPSSSDPPYEFRTLPWFVDGFTLGMWDSIHALDPDTSDDISADDSQLTIWIEVFKLHSMGKR